MDGFSNVSIMKKLVPITRFNKGEANKIFEEVQEYGTRIVMKNNRPACVLMSPEQYESLMEMLSDQILLEEAENRMVRNDDHQNISHEEMMKRLGISRDELDDTDVTLRCNLVTLSDEENYDDKTMVDYSAGDISTGGLAG